jgi:sulfur relay protein TusB/DsrH
MLVLIKSGPGERAQKALELARLMQAEVLFLQNGVLLCQERFLGNFPGRVYVLAEDLRLRGLSEGRAEPVSHQGLVELMSRHEKTLGLF